MAEQITTSDGLALEAEWTIAEDARAGVVLCHPHPLHGGTMRSLVVSTLFEELPAAGVTCVRFNFRGVEGSAGEHGDGLAEQLDVEAAVDALAAVLPEHAPLVLAGWSFGADLALSHVSERLAGWVAIAAPLRWGDPQRAGRDERAKLLLLAEHDEVRDPAAVRRDAASWLATEIEVVAGASHFFVGRTDRVASSVRHFVDARVGAP